MTVEQCCNKMEFETVDLQDKPPLIYCKNCQAEWKPHWEEEYSVPVEEIREMTK